MLNNIPELQNSDLHMRQLRAQRSLYSRSKALRGLQVFFAIPIALGWSIAASIFPRLGIWAALWGICIGLLDACVIDTVQEIWRKTAASIQELFDCELLSIDWNDAMVGSRPAPEIISKYATGSNHRLENWYPTSVGDVPLDAARVICQRSNLWWDAELRRTYNVWMVSILIIVCAVALTAGLLRGMTLENFVLTILAPLSPSFHWVIKEYKAQRKAAETSDRLRIRSEALWNRLLSGTLTNPKQESRSLQDDIFDKRRSSPAIFDWIYNLLRNRHEQQMNYAAAELVRQFQRSSNSAASAKTF